MRPIHRSPVLKLLANSRGSVGPWKPFSWGAGGPWIPFLLLVVLGGVAHLVLGQPTLQSRAEEPSAKESSRPADSSSKRRQAASTLDTVGLPSEAVVVICEKITSALRLIPRGIVVPLERYQKWMKLDEELRQLKARLGRPDIRPNECHLTGKVEDNVAWLTVRFKVATRLPRTSVSLACGQALPTSFTCVREGRQDKPEHPQKDSRSARTQAGACMLRNSGGGFVAELDQPGTYTLTLDMVLPLESLTRTPRTQPPLTNSGEERFLRLDLPRAAVTTLSLSLPKGARELQIATRASPPRPGNLDREGQEAPGNLYRPLREVPLLRHKGDTLQGPLGDRDDLQLRWKQSPRASGTRDLQSLRTAEGTVRVHLTPNSMSSAALLTLKTRKPVRSWTLSVPPRSQLQLSPALKNVGIRKLDKKTLAALAASKSSSKAKASGEHQGKGRLEQWLIQSEVPRLEPIMVLVTTPTVRWKPGRTIGVGPFKVLEATRQTGTLLVGSLAPHVHPTFQPRSGMGLGGLIQMPVTDELRESFRDPFPTPRGEPGSLGGIPSSAKGSKETRTETQLYSILAAFQYGWITPRSKPGATPRKKDGSGSSSWLDIRLETIRLPSRARIWTRVRHELALLPEQGDREGQNSGSTWKVTTQLDVHLPRIESNQLKVRLPSGYTPDLDQVFAQPPPRLQDVQLIQQGRFLLLSLAPAPGGLREKEPEFTESRTGTSDRSFPTDFSITLRGQLQVPGPAEEQAPEGGKGEPGKPPVAKKASSEPPEERPGPPRTPARSIPQKDSRRAQKDSRCARNNVTRVRLNLPVPEGTFDQGGEVSVRVPRTQELVDPKRLSLPSHRLPRHPPTTRPLDTFPGQSGKGVNAHLEILRSGKGIVVGRHWQQTWRSLQERAPTHVDVAWRVHRPEVRVLSVANIDLERTSARVHQELHFRFAETPPDQLLLKVPRQAENSLRITRGGTRQDMPVATEIGKQAEGESGYTLLKVGLPDDHQEQKHVLVLEYGFSQKVARENFNQHQSGPGGTSPGEFQVPLVIPTGATHGETRVRIWPGPLGVVPVSGTRGGRGAPGNLCVEQGDTGSTGAKQSRQGQTSEGVQGPPQESTRGKLSLLEPWMEVPIEEVPGRDSLPSLVLRSQKIDAPLWLRSGSSTQPSEAQWGVWPTRALMQVQILPDQSQRWLAHFLIHRLTTSKLEIALPAPASVLQLRARIKVPPSQGARGQGSRGSGPGSHSQGQSWKTWNLEPEILIEEGVVSGTSSTPSVKVSRGRLSNGGTVPARSKDSRYARNKPEGAAEAEAEVVPPLAPLAQGAESPEQKASGEDVPQGQVSDHLHVVVLHLNPQQVRPGSILELSFHIPPGYGPSSFFRTRLEPPVLLGQPRRGLPTCWQVRVPPGWVILTPENGPGVHRMWSWHGWLWTPGPVTGAGDRSNLAHWFTGALDPLAEGDSLLDADQHFSGEPVLVCWCTTSAPLLVVQATQRTWLLLCSLGLLLVGLGVHMVTRPRHRKVPQPQGNGTANVKSERNSSVGSQKDSHGAQKDSRGARNGVRTGPRLPRKGTGYWRSGGLVPMLALVSMVIVIVGLFWPTLLGNIIYGAEPGIVVLLSVGTLQGALAYRASQRLRSLPAFRHSQQTTSSVRPRTLVGSSTASGQGSPMPLEDSSLPRSGSSARSSGALEGAPRSPEPLNRERSPDADSGLEGPLGGSGELSPHFERGDLPNGGARGEGDREIRQGSRDLSVPLTPTHREPPRGSPEKLSLRSQQAGPSWTSAVGPLETPERGPGVGAPEQVGHGNSLEELAQEDSAPTVVPTRNLSGEGTGKMGSPGSVPPTPPEEGERETPSR